MPCVEPRSSLLMNLFLAAIVQLTASIKHRPSSTIIQYLIASQDRNANARLETAFGWEQKKSNLKIALSAELIPLFVSSRKTFSCAITDLLVVN